MTGTAIRQAREALGMGQADLGRAMGVPGRVIRRHEGADTPITSPVAKLIPYALAQAARYAKEDPGARGAALAQMVDEWFNELAERKLELKPLTH